MFKNKMSHPSFGAISVTRTQSSGAHAMYGSSVRHRNTIRIQIRHSELTRELSRDWCSSHGLICELEMTQNQWAEFVSSIGMGNGVPCTIRWNGGEVEPCPSISKQEQFEREFQNDVMTSTDAMDKAIAVATELLQKKSLTKADREELLSLLRTAKNSITDGIPFIQKQFNEQMERTSTEVKGELEAWQANRMQEIALRALAAGAMEQDKPQTLGIELPGVQEGE